MNSKQKKNLLSNIDYLTKKYKIKKSDLETEAGYSKGYLSRFRGDDPDNLPAVSYLEHVARRLHINMESLLNTNLAAVSETEIYLTRFLSKLISDTNEQSLCWVIVDPSKKMERLKNQKDSNSLFAVDTFEVELLDPTVTVTDEDGEEYDIPLDVYEESGRDLSSCDIGTHIEETEELIFKPLTAQYEEYTYDDELSPPFIFGSFDMLLMKNNVKLFLFDVANYGHREKDLFPHTYKSLWLVSDDNPEELINGSETSSGLKSLLDVLEQSISFANMGISKKAKIILDDYLGESL